MVLTDNTFLLDPDFLKLLDLEREKEVFVKIISLDFDENTLEAIEGRVTQGSISIDGTSSVRRTCSLSIEASELNIHDFYWGLNTKFKLYVGLTNVVKQRQPYRELYKNYPDICWFNMGTYIISSFSTSQSTNQYSISIQGKDKMSLLNGEVGGIITPLSWDFGKIDEIQPNGSIIHNDYLLKDIILEAVHQHAQEPFWNIIVNDLDDCGLELLEYRGDKPLYLLYDLDTNEVQQGYMEDNITAAFLNNEHVTPKKTLDNIIFDSRISNLDGEFQQPTIFTYTTDSGSKRYTLIRAGYGDVIGYRTTDLTYPGDLIANVGDPVTSVLDKIVSMLGDFEYFFDVDGRFIFQRKKTYLKSTFSPIEDDGSGDGSSLNQGIYVENAAETSACVYSFENSLLVTSFSNDPDFANIKNDFSLWGERTGISGVAIPIHLRYAIDTKPWYYKNYKGEVYVSKQGKIQHADLIGQSYIECDWRELIYQMSLDYNKHNHDEDFLITIDNNNILSDGTHLYLAGKTKYEQYYIDINGFWRDLYDPNYTFTLQVSAPTKTEFDNNRNTYFVYQNCGTLGLTYNQVKKAVQAWKNNGCDGLFYYYNYKNKIVSLSSIPTEEEYNSDPEYYYFLRKCGAITDSAASTKVTNALEYDINEIYYIKVTGEYDLNTHWVSTLIENPEGINFWFDFLDTEGDLEKYKVCNIGDRTKATNDTNIKSIYFRDVPTVIFVNKGTSIAEEKAKKGTGYTYVQVPDYIENLFSMSTQWKSAMDVLNEWLYSYAYCAESISINTLPIYYLEPNTRILVRDDNSGINGEYIITRLNIPLSYSGTMSISATKAVENLY